MATDALSWVTRVPGRLTINPSSLSGSFPYSGGTDAGKTSLVELHVEAHEERITEEGFGRKITANKLHLGETWKLRVRFRAPGASTYRMFLNGSASQVAYPGSKAPGTWLWDQGVKLLFVPRDPLKWAIYFKNAVGLVRPVGMPHGEERDFFLEGEWEATKPSSGNAVQWGPISGIAL